MPFTMRGGVRLYWKLDGEDARPPLVLLNSIGTDMSLWESALPYLHATFRTLRIDARGHGASDAPGGDYDLAMLAGDVAAVMEEAGIDRAAVAGVSLGGMVAMQLALDHPEAVDALAIVCSSAAMDPAAWSERIAAVRAGGTASIADLAVGRFFSPEFVKSHPATAQGVRRALTGMAAQGYAGASAAIRDMDLLNRLPDVAQRTLVIGGHRDVSTPFAEHGRMIADRIPQTEVAHLDVGHLAPIEAPSALAATLRRFFSPAPAVDAAAVTLFDAGLLNRRRVLGDDWVDRALAGRTPFNADFQAMITRVAWQEVWGRPGLDDTTRRLLVLVITAALGRWEEFALHVRAGLERGGFTRDQLKEVLMQLAVYAGVPAANAAFSEVDRILVDLDP
jgi:3-oxoadipate enol-lactonase/4-carboxymuconolactone decarboxylase